MWAQIAHEMSKLQEEPTQQAKLVDQVANLRDLQVQDQQLARIMGEEMTHCKQVSVLSHLYLQQVENVKAQSQEICHLLALVEEQHVAIKKLSELSSPQSPPRTPGASTSCSESWLDVMWEEMFNLIPGMVNTRRGAAVASYSTTMATPIIDKTSFEDMLAEEANYTPSHQPRHVRFADMMQGGLTSTPSNLPEEVALPPRPVLESYPDKIELHAAAPEFKKMWEPKISKLKGGYTSSAGLVFESWLKDLCVHVQDRWLTKREAIQLVKDFTMECA